MRILRLVQKNNNNLLMDFVLLSCEIADVKAGGASTDLK